MSNVVALRAENRAQITTPVKERGHKVAENKRTGFVLLYRSLQDAPFKQQPERFCVWIHLLMEAGFESCEVTFNRNVLQRRRGQVVTSAKQLGLACGVTEDSARRSLEYFEREGMVTMFTKRGSRGYSLVTLTNYDDYQRGITETYSAGFDADLKAAPELGSEGGRAELHADYHAELHAEDLNNKTNKQIKDQSIGSGGSCTADAEHSPRQEEQGADDQGVPDGAAIHAKRGKRTLWGTHDDLRCAQWLAGLRDKAFERRELAQPKQPDMVLWANDVRLMRERDGRTHRDICELFKFVCSHHRELEFTQSPGKLRDNWDMLRLKAANTTQQPQRATGAMSNVRAAQARAAAYADLLDDDQEV
ncbi:hypothetical protein [Zobellella sp. DQSA1]|uniref:hypothetical protein n=1 Tax=Zobellella sp. DQSA1 TaxID=3342386 RepID=UPI0035BECD50